MLRIASGMRILPTSCRSAANSASRRSRGESPIASATASVSETTSRLWLPVYASSASITSPRSSAVPRYAWLSSSALSRPARSLARETADEHEQRQRQQEREVARLAAIAARKPIGASRRSTVKTSCIWSSSCGRPDRERRPFRAAVLTKSDANCAASSAMSSGHCCAVAVGSPATTITAAGPSANQPLPPQRRAPTRGAPAHDLRKVRSTRAARTARGTTRAGTRNSSGMRKSSVGMAKPVPDLEPHTGGGRVRDRQENERDRMEAARGRHGGRERDGDGDEQRGVDPAHPDRAPAPVEAARSRLAETIVSATGSSSSYAASVTESSPSGTDRRRHRRSTRHRPPA